MAQALPVTIEFGPGGPRVRLFVGDDAAIEALPPAPIEARRVAWVLPATATIFVGVIVLLLLRC